MNFEEFKILMLPIETYNTEYDKQAQALDLLCPDSFATPSLGAFLLESYIQLLSKYIGDTSEFISYYVWECNMGKNP